MSLAPFGRRLLNVTGVDRLGAYHVLRVADVDQDGLAFVSEPGQFAMLAAHDGWGGDEQQRPFLGRAFSIARISDGEAHFLLEDVGPGTKRLCQLQAGERLWARRTARTGLHSGRAGLEQRTPILVGGGVGIAPLAILQDRLLAAGAGDGGDPVVLLGFRDREHAHGAALLTDAHVASDDGSVGHHGYVTELLAASSTADPHAVVYACGPPPMLESVRALCAQRQTPAQLALEAGMACGFGACFGCVVPRRGGGYLRVCVDGPVVDAAALDRVSEPAGPAESAGRRERRASAGWSSPTPSSTAPAPSTRIAAANAFGERLARSFPFAAYVSKTITLQPRAGNPPPRLWEAPGRADQLDRAAQQGPAGLPHGGPAAAGRHAHHLTRR